MSLEFFPPLNASLNATAGVFLCLGWVAIRQNRRQAHKKLMIAAFFASVVFLISYVSYHFLRHGMVTRYEGEGVSRIIYFFVLGTHTPLAVLIVPFILLALRHGLRGEFDKHVRITRWLLPTWLYVSVTGVVIYLMLYVL